MANDVWNGAAANWNTAADWSLGVPNASSLAVINSGNCVITSAATASTVTLGSTATLTQNAALTLGAGGMTVNAGTLSYGANLTTTYALQLGSGATKIKNNGHNIYLNGVISGAGSLSISGAGGVGLNGANTYTGGTTVVGGTILTNASTGFGTGALSLSGGAQLYLGSGITVANAVKIAGSSGIYTQVSLTQTLSGVVSDGASAGAIVVNGPGVLALSGANTYTGGTTVDGGSTLALSAGGAAGTGALTLQGGSTLDLTTAFSLNNALVLNGDDAIGVTQNYDFLNGLISGAGALTFSGGGGVYLDNASNSYSGGTTVNGGLLVVNSNGVLGSGALNLTGGASVYFGDDTITNTVTVSGNANLNVLIGYAATLYGLIGDGASPGALTVDGPGSLYISNSGNSYTGGTTVDGGSTLVVSAAGDLGAGPLTLEGGSTLLTTASFSNSFAITLAGGVATVNRDSQGVYFNGVISGPGALDITGGGQIALDAANTYAGGTTVESGQIYLFNASALGTGALLLEDGAQVFIGGNYTVANAVTLNGLATINYFGAGTATWSGVIADGASAGVLDVGGVGVLALSGANTYSGGTEVTSGATLSISAADNLGTGGLTLDGGSTLDLAGNLTLDAAITLGTGSATINLGAYIVQPALDGVISGAGSLVLEHGVVTLGGANTFSGLTLDDASVGMDDAAALGSGTVTLEANSALYASANYTIANNLVLDGVATLGALNSGAAFSGVISDGAKPGVLDIEFSSGVTLSGANLYSGGTDVDDGATLSISAADNIGAGALTLEGGATLDLTAAFSLGNAITLNGAAYLVATQGTVFLNGQITGTGSISISGGALVYLDSLGPANTYSGGTTVAGGTLVLNNPGVLGSGALNLTGGAGTVSYGDTFANALTIAGTSNLDASSGVDGSVTTLTGILADGASAGAIVVTGPGSLTLEGANTYSGGTTVSGGSTLILASGGTVGSGALALQAGSTFEMTGNEAIGNAITLGGAVSVVATSYFAEWDGVVSGTGPLDLSGGGGLILSAANTFTGGIVATGTALVTYSATGFGTGAIALSGGANVDFSAGGAFTVANKISIAGVSNFFDPTANVAKLTGVISNGASAGSITTNNLGVLQLAAANTYTGGTTINAGELELLNLKALGAGKLTFAGAGDLDYGLTGAYSNAIAIGSGVAASLSAEAGVTGVVTGAVSGAGGLTLTGAGRIVISGAIATGSNGVTQTGTGIDELSGVNTYTGATNINAGTLQIAGASSIYADDAVNVASGAALSILTGATIGALSGAGTVFTASAAFYVGSGGASSSFSGVIKNGAAAGAINKVGAGKLSLSGTSTFTGGSSLDAGTVSISNMSALGTGNVNFVGSDDALESTVTGTFSRTIVYQTGGSGTLEATAGLTLTLNGLFSEHTPGSVGTIQFGSAGDTGTVNLAPASILMSAGGALAVAGGTLTLGNANAVTVVGDVNAVAVGTGTTAATLNVNGQAATLFDLTGTSAGVILDNGAAATLSVFENASTTFGGSLRNGTGVLSLNDADTGATTLTLTGANTYTGATTIALDQTLALAGAGSDSRSAITIGQSAAFDISGLSGAVANVLSLSGSATTSAVNLAGKSLVVSAEASASPTLLFEGSTGTAASHLTIDTALANFSLANAVFSNWASTHSTIAISDATAGATLTGSSQNDTIYGASGDTLTGGAGANAFMFAAPPAADETITDFSAAQGDYIGVSHTGFPALGLSAGQALPAADFHVGSAIGNNAQFVWNTQSSTLFYDAQGASGSQIALATLTGVTTLVAANIHVY